ncbi:MAG: hypothetical protein RI897_4648, partial [Verrucomicrobiota bacterium]
LGKLERAKGFEPSTSTLARLRSTRLSYARFHEEQGEKLLQGRGGMQALIFYQEREEWRGERVGTRGAQSGKREGPSAER